MPPEPLNSVLLLGEKVLLQPLHERWADAAFDALAGREPILRWLVWAGPGSREELRELYRHWIRETPEGRVYQLAILDAETRGFQGQIGLTVRDASRAGELGYWVAEAGWGRGYATEAVRLVSWLAFRHLAASLVSARVFAGNDASRAVLERNGYRYVRATTIRGEDREDGPDAILELARADFERAPSRWAPRAAVVNGSDGLAPTS